MDGTYLIAPDPDGARLTRIVRGVDQTGAEQDIRVVEERPLTIYLNGQEIVTAMTIGDHPAYLAVGFLLNQGMLRPEDVILGVDHDEEVEAVVVRTARQTDYEEKLRKKTRTSGCAVGTVFGDMMAGLEGLVLPASRLPVSDLYALAAAINTTPSLYLAAGAIHGTVLCQRRRPLVYMEDVGRHNAVDKIAGWMALERVAAADKLLYTTGRLTSEMVIKTGRMGVPALAGRYVYGDFVKGEIRSARLAAGRASDDRDTGLNVGGLSSFGEDGRGRVYAVSLYGSVYRLTAG